MAHAAIAFAKASRRRRMMACTTSIGPGRHQHGDGRRGRACQPPAGAAAARRRVRQPPPRSGAAADRGFRRRHRLGQRLLPPGLALFRPHHAARADHPGARSAPCTVLTDPAECGPGDPRALPGRAGGGLRLSRELLRRAGLDAAPHPARRGRARRGRRRSCSAAKQAAHRRRRRRALFAAPRRRSPHFAARHGIPVGETQAGKSSLAARPSAGPRRASASPAPAPPTRSPRRPTWCSRSARACRISPPAPGRCSRTRSGRIIGLNVQAVRRRQARARMPLVADARAGLDELGARRSAAGGAARPGRAAPRTREARWLADGRAATPAPTNAALPSDAQVIGAVQRSASAEPTSWSAPRAACRASCTSSGRPARAARLPPGIRLFLHGLRDRRRPRRQDGPARRARSSSWSATAPT